MYKNGPFGGLASKNWVLQVNISNAFGSKNVEDTDF
jgi:hypothetical protein